MRIIIVTGLSGAGKATALRALEDVGFYCVDNLPITLVAPFVEQIYGAGISDAAIAVDARQKPFLSAYGDQVGTLRSRGHQVEVLYLEAEDEVLVRRYSETRRRHPLAGDDLPDGIRQDRELLAALRAEARNAIVRTDALNVHQLKGIIQERYGRREGQLAITLLSFGFKHGLPVEADLVWDVRFLPNPYFVEELSARDGRDPDVVRFVLGGDEGRELMQRVEGFVRFSLPQYEREGKLYLTVSVGCTGGRHRSVAVVEELGKRLGDDWELVVRHRDLDRG